MNPRRGPKSVAGSASPARIALWNGLVLGALLVVLFALFEVYLRTTYPFMGTVRKTEFVPGVGMRLRPGSEVHATNTRDYWTISRVNSLGFLDREPPTPERAATSCHVAIVGDSFVEAFEVPIADKLQVRLEDMAQELLPEWDVTTAAYGRQGTGQIDQLLWWHKWIIRRPPKLVVLVFVINDFPYNARRMHWQSADGQFIPVPRHIQVQPSPRLPYVAYWLGARTYAVSSRVSRAYRAIVGSSASFDPASPPPVSDDEMSSPLSLEEEATAFVLDQWQQRTQQASASLVVLTTHTMGLPRNRLRMGYLEKAAGTRAIPIVDQMDYIVRQGGNPDDATFEHDAHWSPQGHQWAAEALLEWLTGNPDSCE